MANYDFDLYHIFSYLAATEEQIRQYHAIREAGKHLAQVIINNSPVCADQTTAISLC